MKPDRQKSLPPGAFVVAVLGIGAAEVSAGPDFQSAVLPILEKNCFECHGDGADKGGVDFDQFVGSSPGSGSVDEYLTGLREIEQRIATAESFDEVPDPEIFTPDGIPARYDEYIRLMFQMKALAFETDATRVSSMILSRDGSNRSFPEIDVAEGHHSFSHHRNNEAAIAKIARIDRIYAERFAEKEIRCSTIP